MASQTLFRRRLVHLIDDAKPRVIYVYGPAGFGKTTIARQWSESSESQTVWVEGISTSNEAELMELLVTSIASVIPSLQKNLNDLEAHNQVDSKFINDVMSAIARHKQPLNLVVDNAEVIRQSHNELARELVTHLPANVKLILLTNTSPRVSFIKNFEFERFSVIGPDELEFTKEEILLLAKQYNSKSTEKEVEEIYSATAGWPAAVGLALSEIALAADLKDALNSIRNLGRKKSSLIVKRSLSNIEDSDLTILSELALLPVIDAESALEISNNLDAVRKLTLISQETAILTQNSFDPPSFSLNPIVRSALIEELQANPEFQEVTERVLNYLISKGDIKATVKILLEIGSVRRLSELLQDERVEATIDASIQDSILRGAAKDLQDWIPVTKWLSEYGDIAREILSFYAALISGDFDSAESHLYAFKDVLNSKDKKIREVWITDLLALESIAHYARGRLQKAFECAMKAFESTLEQRVPRRRHQVTYLQLVLWGAVISDDDKKVEKIKNILESKEIRESAATRNASISAMRALIAAQEGRFTETRNLLVTPISRSSNRPHNGFFGNYGVKMAQSLLLLEAGDTDSSIAILADAATEARVSKNWVILIGMLGRISYLKILGGDKESALRYIEEARNIIDSQQLSPELHESIDIWETRVRYFVKDYDRANELMKRSRTSYLMKAFEAAIQIDANPRKALELTENIARQNPRHELTYHLFRAHIFADKPRLQLEEIKKAVEIGSKHGYFNHFLTQRSDVIQAYISLAAEYPTAFNERLARAAGEKLHQMMVGDFSSNDSLTRREAEILRHLATGLPLKEIAVRLNISKNTLKTHLRNLYKKLEAQDRNDAVAKGKKLLKV